jgi:hypothetical protein
MIRIIVHTQYLDAAAHVDGAKAEHSYRTFDLEAADLEAFLRGKVGSLGLRQVVGAEVIDAAVSSGKLGTP